MDNTKRIIISLGVMFLTFLLATVILFSDYNSPIKLDDIILPSLMIEEIEVTTPTLLEIVSYSIVTISQSGENIGNGFIHQDNSGFYIITGNVRNNLDKLISTITIKTNFYDGNNNYLHTEEDYIYSLDASYTDEFKIFYFSYEEYFENVERVEFEIEY